MLVLDTTSDDLDLAVLLFPHDWSVALSIAHTFPGTVTAGQSGREARRPRAEDIRHTLAIHLIHAEADAQEFRHLLATLGTGYVGIPLWTDQHPGADWPTARIYDPERLFDLTAQAIVAKGAPLVADHLYAPLLVGHLAELPPTPTENSRLADFTFKVIEDSPWTFRIGINAAGAAGTWPADLAPDWTTPAEERPERPLEYRQIGDQRERMIDAEESVFRWGQTAPFTLTRSQIRTLLAFFAASEGMRRKFDTPCWFAPGVATAAAPHSTKARFAESTLTLDYHAPAVATTRITLVQVPWELVAVEGEQPEQPPRVFLYRFQYQLPAPVIYRFTNWPRPLTRTADGTYTPAPMLHRQIPDALDVRSHRVILDSFHFAGNPLTLFHPDRIEAPLRLEIYAADTWPIDPDLAVRVFVGDVKTPKRQSRSIEAPVIFLAGLLEREFPRVRVGPACNTTLFSPRCGLARAAHLRAGTLTAKDATSTQLTIATAAADAENTFALGTVEVGAGADWEQRHIVASEPIAGGQLLTVDWPLRQAATGQALAFVRGCDRTWETCQTLGNSARFRGHPHIPQVNLSLPTMALPSAPGKK